MDDQKTGKISLDTLKMTNLFLNSIDKFLEKDVKPYVKSLNLKISILKI